MRSRRITGVRNFQAGAGIAAFRLHVYDPLATIFERSQNEAISATVWNWFMRVKGAGRPRSLVREGARV